MTKRWSSTASMDGQTKRQASKAERRRVLPCGCVLGYERCFDCRPGLHMDQETAAYGEKASAANIEAAADEIWRLRAALRQSVNLSGKSLTAFVEETLAHGQSAAKSDD